MESNASIELAKHTLALIGVVLSSGIASALLAGRLRVPDVVVFLFTGIFLGPEVMALIHVETDSAFNQLILIFGSSYILFDGGKSLRFNIMKEVWITVVSLSTLGVLVTAILTGWIASYVFGLTPMVAFLLGSVIASTDPATLIPVFKQVRIKDRLAQTVLSESAFNDAMAAILTFSILGIVMGNHPFFLNSFLTSLFQQSILGVAIGGSMGYLAAVLIAHEKYNFLAEYASATTLMAVIGAYMAADGLQASGFMAVFMFGVVLGNHKELGFKAVHQEEAHLEQFVLSTAFVMRTFIFILLGSQVNFALIQQHGAGSIIVVALFMVIVRPITVFICAAMDRQANWSRNELLFMCWTRETGVIPGALAGMLLGIKAPGAEIIASVTFVAILMTLLLQATTTKWLAKKLNVAAI